MINTTDTAPMSLAAWRLINSKSPESNEMNNIGFEFAGVDAPKYKFLYTVAFNLGPLLKSYLSKANRAWDDTNMETNIIPCKSVNRPNITVNYVDINSYNYRYKVATKVDYGTVTITMYDDNKNMIHSLLESYLSTISPISVRTLSDYKIEPLEQNLKGWSSVGDLPNKEANGLIESMVVTHYVDRNYRGNNNDHKKVIYEYMNPKIQNFTLDDLDMSSSDVSTITLTFVYDSVNITTTYDNTGDPEKVGKVIVGTPEVIRD